MGLDIDLFRIDENRVSIRFHVPAVPSVDKEGSRISLERLFERLQNRLPILLILSGLLGVQADDIALTSDPGFFDLQGEGVLGRSSFRPNLAEPRVAASSGKNLLLNLAHPAHSGAEDIGSELIIPRSATRQKAATWKRSRIR